MIAHPARGLPDTDAVARRLVGGIVVLVVLAGAGCVAWRASWHGWPWREPAWVHWCGRDYEAGGLRAGAGGLHAAGRYPPVVGRRLYSTVEAPARAARRRRGDACDTLVYRSTGSGYRTYALLGGP
jgi:hypothetical protein